MKRTLLALTAPVVAAVILTGCGSVDALLSTRHEEYFDTYAEASDGWVGGEIPSWIPADSTAVRSITTDDGDSRIIHVTTGSDPIGSCETAPRPSVTALPSGWTPNTFPAEVTACGDYSIVAFDSGWFGWTATGTAEPTTGAAK